LVLLLLCATSLYRYVLFHSLVELLCVTIAWCGAQAAWSSYASGAVNIRTLVTPEWWALALLPAVFILLAIEMCFRLVRLYQGDRAPRKEAVSAA